MTYPPPPLSKSQTKICYALNFIHGLGYIRTYAILMRALYILSFNKASSWQNGSKYGFFWWFHLSNNVTYFFDLFNLHQIFSLTCLG